MISQIIKNNNSKYEEKKEVLRRNDAKKEGIIYFIRGKNKRFSIWLWTIVQGCCMGVKGIVRWFTTGGTCVLTKWFCKTCNLFCETKDVLY